MSTKYIVVVWYVSENNSPPRPPVYPRSEYPSCLALCILHSAIYICLRFLFAVDTGPVGLNRARRGSIMGAADGPGQYGERKGIISCGLRLLFVLLEGLIGS